ncbi:hypothetical protein LTR94_029748 [Friedmanniomyces endolithicus]|nr:hypothetical protein LTR94_029748 [Friedmanniomyces endolithicus]
MANNVASISSVTSSVPSIAPVSKPAPEASAAPANDAAEDPTRFRLTIEATSAGRFVYKVLDRVTGEVIRQLPREQVAMLGLDPNYSGGQVVDTAV